MDGRILRFGVSAALIAGCIALHVREASADLPYRLEVIPTGGCGSDSSGELVTDEAYGYKVNGTDVVCQVLTQSVSGTSISTQCPTTAALHQAKLNKRSHTDYHVLSEYAHTAKYFWPSSPGSFTASTTPATATPPGCSSMSVSSRAYYLP
jgi:hypothetical protein